MPNASAIFQRLVNKRSFFHVDLLYTILFIIFIISSLFCNLHVLVFAHLHVFFFQVYEGIRDIRRAVMMKKVLLFSTIWYGVMEVNDIAKAS